MFFFNHIPPTLQPEPLFVRELQALVIQPPPQRVRVRGHAGRAVNKLSISRKVDIRLRGKGDSNSHGARPVHQKHRWTRTSRLSIMNSLSLFLYLSVLGLVVPSFRALSGRLTFTARRHKLNTGSLSLVSPDGGPRPPGGYHFGVWMPCIKPTSSLPVPQTPMV